MTRRVAALLTASVLLVALTCVALIAPLPYVVMSPGGSQNVLGKVDGKEIVQIEGHRTYPDNGRLDLTTVRVTNSQYHPRLPELLEAWVDPDEAVIPRDVVYPPDQSAKDVEQAGQTQMLDSQSAAVVAGLGEAGIDALDVEVEEVTAGTPAEGVLREGDLIMSVDGERLESRDEVIAAISGREPGESVTIGIERAGRASAVTIKTAPSPDDESKARVGVRLSETFEPPFEVSIDVGDRIGGPSAGLMFSLAVYDLLTPGSLTDGQHIAGTGEIGADGDVGGIGSIQQKMIGAYDEGATWFLVPEDNCAAALGSGLANDELKLIRVASLHDARTALESLADGDTDSIPTCEN